MSLDYTFFKDYTVIQKYKSIRPGRKAGDPTVTNVRAFAYNGEVIKYKLDFNDQFQELPTRPKV